MIDTAAPWLLVNRGSNDSDNFFCSYFPIGAEEPFLGGDYVDLYTSEDQNCVCASACALVWLGGIRRDGTVGLHRSYLADGVGIEYSLFRETLERNWAKIDEYLDEIGSPEWLAHKILSTASTEMVFVHNSEGLELDPAFEEYLLARCSSRLSTAEEKLRLKLFAAELNGASLSATEREALAGLSSRAKEQNNCVTEASVRLMLKAQPADSN